MANIINLRQARKARERAEAEAQAERNRVKFGLSKAERRSAKRATSSPSSGTRGIG